MPDGCKLVPRAKLDELALLSTTGKPVTLSPALLQLLLSHVATIEEALALYAGDFCEVCGCTQEMACEEGCAWVDSGRTLCSACEDLVEPTGLEAASGP
ncbi:MAG TPA: hypothetical protein VG963_15995 [Polyangiaceae bacterium]|nr:hypothetical protein [Polyangiaceae bacterium]